MSWSTQYYFILPQKEANIYTTIFTFSSVWVHQHENTMTDISTQPPRYTNLIGTGSSWVTMTSERQETNDTFLAPRPLRYVVPSRCGAPSRRATACRTACCPRARCTRWSCAAVAGRWCTRSRSARASWTHWTCRTETTGTSGSPCCWRSWFSTAVVKRWHKSMRHLSKLQHSHLVN